MSQEHVQNIIGRAVSDPAFRALLFSDPGKALAGYELTDAEMAALRGLTPEQFDSRAADLETRTSRSTLMGIKNEQDQKGQ
jgi:Ribosomally synthesized peptide prototyped by Frankia Franean1_4349.